MKTRHAYGELLLRLDFGRWYWDALFMDVCYIPKGRQRPTMRLHLSYRENTEVGALCAIVREISPRKGGGKSVD